MIMRVRLGLLKEYINENYAWILEEGRIEDAKAKYPNVSAEDFKKSVDEQPAGTNNKYLFWTLKQITAGATADAALQSVSSFETNKQRLEKKDINLYQDVAELDAAVEKLGVSKASVAKKVSSDTDIIYQDDRFLVLRPFTKDSSCKYGVGTQWCIAATTSQNYFESYSTGNNKFYFVIDKKGTPKTPESKYAIAIVAQAGNVTQVYDASDKLVPLSTVEKLVGEKWDEIWKRILEHLKQKPLTREAELAQKAVEEHVRMLVAGEKLPEPIIRTVAAKAKLTKDVVSALVKYATEFNSGPMSYGTDYAIFNALSGRADSMDSDAAMVLISYAMEARSKLLGSYGNVVTTHVDYMFEQILKNAQLSAQDFQDLSKVKDELILVTIIENPSVPSEIKDQIVARVDEFKSESARTKILWQTIKDGTIRLDVLRREMPRLKSRILQYTDSLKLTPQMIELLLPIQDTYSLGQVMKFQNVTDDIIVKSVKSVIQHSSDVTSIFNLLKTASFSEEVIEKIWIDNKSASTARAALLQNPLIGVDNLKKFALSKNSSYRFSVAHNQLTPANELDILSNDESVSTRSAVAAHPNTKPETLKLLAGDEAVSVRAAVAGNPSTSLDVLEAMKKDSDSHVKKAANNSIKTRKTTESAIQFILNSGSLIIEGLEDDGELEDYMTPSWRQLPRTSEGTSANFRAFVCVFLLQNNGHAVREDIIDAYNDWSGIIGTAAKFLTQGATGSVNNHGHWWSNNVTKKGAIFHLTPAGVALARTVLNRARRDLEGKAQERVVDRTNARKGNKYYTQSATTALDVTGYENYHVKKFEAMADANGEPLKNADGMFKSIYSIRNYRGPQVEVYSATPFKENGKPDLKNEKHIRTMNYVQVPKDAEVTFIRTNHVPRDLAYSPGNTAVVKYGDKSIVVPLPLWAAREGAVPTAAQPGKLGNVIKSPPAKSLARKPVAPPARTPRVAATTTDDAPVQTAAPVRRGAKSTYKIYGKFKGHPAATRLKGQAYVGAADTQFRSGEQAIIEPEDGKLRVKKTTGDHSQLWDPIDG